MVIHFICRGNTFRSRLAEAYAKSLLGTRRDITVCSSGINADEDLLGAISSYTVKLASAHHLEKFMAPHWTQTTQAMLDTADRNVFLNDDVRADAEKRFSVPTATSETWYIPDLNQSPLDENGIYIAITTEVRRLFASLKVV